MSFIFYFHIFHALKSNDHDNLSLVQLVHGGFEATVQSSSSQTGGGMTGVEEKLQQLAKWLDDHHRLPWEKSHQPVPGQFLWKRTFEKRWVGCGPTFHVNVIVGLEWLRWDM